MATRSAPPAKKGPVSEPARYTCEDLVRLLVRQTASQSNCSPQTRDQANGHNNEEIILDVDLDGAHYLLIRLPNESRSHVQLSPREHEIVRMVAKGHSNKIIADVLNISSWTVCTHVRRIFAKLGVGSRAAMVAKTMEESRPWEQESGGEKPLVTVASMPGSSKSPAVAGSTGKLPSGNRSFSRRAS